MRKNSTILVMVALSLSSCGWFRAALAADGSPALQAIDPSQAKMDTPPPTKPAPPPSPNPLGRVNGAPVSGNRQPPMLPQAPYAGQPGYPYPYPPAGYQYPPGYGYPPQQPGYPPAYPPAGYAPPYQTGYPPQYAQPYPQQPAYAPPQGYPAQGYPPAYAASPAGYAPQGYPAAYPPRPSYPAQAGYPQGGYPQAGYPPAGAYPPAQAPQGGYPQGGMAPVASRSPSGYPNEGMIPDFNKPLPAAPPGRSGAPSNGSGWATNVPMTPPPSGDEDRVMKLEQAAFGSTYPEHEVEDRVDHLEKEIFGSTSQGSMSDRISKLETKIGGAGAFGHTNAPSSSNRKSRSSSSEPAGKPKNHKSVVASNDAADHQTSDAPQAETPAAEPSSTETAQKDPAKTETTQSPATQNQLTPESAPMPTAQGAMPDGSQLAPAPTPNWLTGSPAVNPPQGIPNPEFNGQPQGSAANVGSGQPQDTAANVGSGQPQDTAANVGSGQPQDTATNFGSGQPQDTATNFGSGSQKDMSRDAQRNPPSHSVPTKRASSAVPVKHSKEKSRQISQRLATGAVNSPEVQAVVDSIPTDSKAGDYFSAIRKFDNDTVARWTSFPITVKLPAESPESWAKNLNLGIAAWNKFIPVQGVPSAENSDVEVSWVNHLLPGVLGITRLSTPQKGSIHVEIWLLRPTFYVQDIPEHALQAAFLHELGHAIGLFGHSSGADDLMSGSESALAARGKTGKIVPVEPKDLNTLKRVYDTPAVSGGFMLPQPIEWSFQYKI